MPFRIVPRLWHVIRDFDHEYTEFFLGLIKTLTGFWLMMPWNSFSSSSGTRYFSTLSPEFVWGFIFLAIGAPQLYLVLRGEHFRTRSYIANAGMYMWVIFTVLTLFGNWRGVGFLWTSVLALSNIGIYLRLRNVSDYVAQRNTLRGV